MTTQGGYGYEPPVRAPRPLPVPPDLVARRRRRGNMAFTVFLSVALFLGAGVMAMVLLGAGAPGALTVGVLFAALPLGPVIACYMWLDRYEPEPLGLLGFALGWGALVATAGALLVQVADRLALGTSEALSALVVAPVSEEAMKGLFVLLLLVARRHEIDGVLDGLVYAGMVGVGFAFTENILYLANAYMGGHRLGPGGIEAATALFVVRGVFSPFAHPLFTSAIGVGVGVAVVTRSRLWRVLAPLLGYVVAVVCHALWNASAMLDGGRLFFLTYLFAMVPAFLLFVVFAVWARYREGRMLGRALTDCANRGLIGHEEVPWLVRLPGRRAARRYARAHGGKPAARVMGEYQQQAVELGFLHDRYLRGTAPRDFAARGTAMVHRLAELRPYTLLPPTVDRTIETPATHPHEPHWEGGR
ncbi:MAG TPA: PrsW family intramembrane metalloprotease [Nocardioidaceae bacterium]|jgi:RsiW-degrading membrane proteinase PrsW (M82 family)